MREAPTPNRGSEAKVGPIDCQVEGSQRPSSSEPTEFDPLVPVPTHGDYRTGANNILRERRSGKTPSPHERHMHRGQKINDDDTAAVASRGSSRQLFYRDRIPPLPGGDVARPTNVTSASTDSTDSSVEPYVSARSLNSGLSYGAASASDRAMIDGNGPINDGGLQPPSSPPSLSPSLHIPSDTKGRHFDNGGAVIQADMKNCGTTHHVNHGQYGHNNAGTLLDVPEEIYAVRQAALTVLDPITYCWLILSIGFSISVAFGIARWTDILPGFPYWAIFLPAWVGHGGIVVMHILSARALSKFISEANENRQRPDSTDHLDRVEYLPLLQKSLKFGLKTALLCFVVFVFEILLFIRLINPGAISLTETYIPFWILTSGYIANGLVCKSQHSLHVIVWVLVFTAMVLSVLRIDHEIEDIRFSYIVIIIVSLLAITSGTLIYVVYGHQIGYFKLTESQLTAGILYSMSAFVCVLLVALLGDAIELPERWEADTKFFILILTPLAVAFVGLGAWAVTRDEFERLLSQGGQSAVIPMKLRLEADGWTSVESRGVTVIPMFGDVRYEPLNSATSHRLLCGACCSCYPCEEDDDLPPHLQGRNAYQSPTPPTVMAATARWGGREESIV